MRFRLACAQIASLGKSVVSVCRDIQIDGYAADAIRVFESWDAKPTLLHYSLRNS